MNSEKSQHKKLKYTKNILEEAAKNSKSVAGVLRYLGLKQAGGTQAHISNRLKYFNIDCSHFTGQSHQKSRPAFNRKTPKQTFVILPEGSRRANRETLLRVMIEVGIEYSCAECDQRPVWNNKPLILHIDHKNGNWLDNRQENLRFLCPNCHTQTETYSKPRKIR